MLLMLPDNTSHLNWYPTKSGAMRPKCRHHTWCQFASERGRVGEAREDPHFVQMIILCREVQAPAAAPARVASAARGGGAPGFRHSGAKDQGPPTSSSLPSSRRQISQTGFQDFCLLSRPSASKLCWGSTTCRSCNCQTYKPAGKPLMSKVLKY